MICRRRSYGSENNNHQHHQEEPAPHPDMTVLTRQFMEAFARHADHPQLLLTMIQDLLHQGVPPDTRIDDRPITPLFFAVHNRHPALVQVLLEAGASVDQTCRISENLFGITPLGLAITLHTLLPDSLPAWEIVQTLIRGGANVTLLGLLGLSYGHQAKTSSLLNLLVTQHPQALHLRCVHGTTPLQHAVWMNDLRKVQLLLQYKELVLVNARTFDNVTALQLAVGGPAGATGSITMVQLLMDAGQANPLVCDAKGRTLAHLAQTTQMLNYLHRTCNLPMDEPDAKGLTAFHVACLRGNLSLAQYLLERAQAAVQGHSRSTILPPFHLACFLGHAHVAKWLVREGHVTNLTQEHDGMTAIHYACMLKQVNVVTWLMEEYALDNTKMCSKGYVPLDLVCTACKGGSDLQLARERFDGIVLAQIFLEMGRGTVTSCNDKTKNDCHPDLLDRCLHFASEWNPELCQILVEHGAHLLSPRRRGSIPLVRAAWSGTTETVACLCNMMNEQQLDVNAADEFGRTALFGAVAMGHVDKVRQLLPHVGCHINATDHNGQTFLHWASRRGQVSMETGFSAEKNCFEDQVDAANHANWHAIQKLLLDRGANPLILDKQGRFALVDPNATLEATFHLVQAAVPFGLLNNNK